MSNTRILSLPADYEARMESELQKLGHSLKEPRKLADAVLRLSDHYTQNPLAPTPWNEPWARAASIAYYFPLNYARNRAVANEGLRLGFFDGLDSLLDVGSGMGAALLAHRDTTNGTATNRAATNRTSLRNFAALDVSDEGLRLGQVLGAQSYRTDVSDTARVPRGFASAANSSANSGTDLQRLLISASYVYTELEQLPSWWLEAEALAIVEPSTQEDGRRLMQLRSQLLEHGFKIWAPCTHQGTCPLLKHSERDWCHDRIHWKSPAWWTEVEKYLPMKNRTLTFSYLLARRSKEPPSSLKELGRLTGDMLEEKGKTRQSLCRGEEREFLSWFPQRMKKGETIHLDRGSLVKLTGTLEKRAAEVRIKSSAEVEEQAPEHDLSKS